MSFKSLLVLLDDAEDSSGRLKVACDMAEHQGAHLTGLALTLQIYPYAASTIDAGAAAIDVGQIEAARERAQAIAAEAKTSIDDSGVSGETRWSSRELAGLRNITAINGRFAELTIAGQPVEGRFTSLREWALEGALFSSGRPVLLMPSGWQGSAKFGRVVVAWDASREAARSLADAIPFIENADETTVVIVDPKPGDQDLGDEPGADIGAVLARHCSNVVVDRIPSSGASVAQALLAHSIDASADLIVMGGYGHSLLRESIFGGVSRDMIHETTIPLLLSH